MTRTNTVADLRAIAAERGIDLTGLTLKADIIAAIEAAGEAAAQEATEALEASTDAADTTSTQLGDYGASILRTAVPSVWGTALAGLLAWLLPLLPGDIGDALSTLLGSEAVTGVLVAASIAGWYAAARWIEPRLPVWLTRLVLGYAASPTYSTAAS